MAKGMYIGVNSLAGKVKKAYIGVSGVAHKIKKMYIGVGGVARLCWSGETYKTLISGNVSGSNVYDFFESTANPPSTFTSLTNPTGATMGNTDVIYDEINKRFVAVYNYSISQKKIWVMPVDSNAWTLWTLTLTGATTGSTLQNCTSIDQDGNIILFSYSSSSYYIWSVDSSGSATRKNANSQGSRIKYLNGKYFRSLVYSTTVTGTVTNYSPAAGLNPGSTYDFDTYYDVNNAPAIHYYNSTYYAKISYTGSASTKRHFIRKSTDLSSWTTIFDKNSEASTGYNYLLPMFFKNNEVYFNVPFVEANQNNANYPFQSKGVWKVVFENSAPTKVSNTILSEHYYCPTHHDGKKYLSYGKDANTSMNVHYSTNASTWTLAANITGLNTYPYWMACAKVE